MNEFELTTVIDESGQLSTNASYLLQQYELKIKEIEKIQQEYRQVILEAMEKSGHDKFDNPFVTVEYRPENEIDVFDVDSFKAEHSKLYGQYFKKRKVKAHVRIKAKL